MNMKHRIDFNRPHAADYEHLRTQIGFWDRLSTPSRSAMVLYFSDASIPLAVCEARSGVCNTALRQALKTRGLLPHSMAVPRQYRTPKVAHADTSASPIGDVIETLSTKLRDIEAQQADLAVEYKKVKAALTALEFLS